MKNLLYKIKNETFFELIYTIACKKNFSIKDKDIKYNKYNNYNIIITSDEYINEIININISKLIILCNLNNIKEININKNNIVESNVIFYKIINDKKYIDPDNLLKLLDFFNYNTKHCIYEYENVFLAYNDKINSTRLYDIDGNYLIGQNLIDEKINFSNTKLFENYDVNKINTNKIFDYCFYPENPWHNNFHIHYMEIFPSVIYFKYLIKTFNNCKLLISEKYLNEYKELFNIFNIDTNLIEIINLSHGHIKIQKIFTLKLPLNGSTFDYNANPFVKIMSLYIKHTFIVNNKINDYDKIIFIKRKKNCLTNSGSERYIRNYDEIEKEIIKKKNIDVYELENLSFYDKFKILSNKKIIFIEFGASIVNLYYCDLKNTKIVFLINRVFYECHALFKSDLVGINNINNFEFIIGELDNNKLEINLKNINNPYTIDLDNIKKNFFKIYYYKYILKK
jgi:hypothetical protein